MLLDVTGWNAFRTQYFALKQLSILHSRLICSGAFELVLLFRVSSAKFVLVYNLLILLEERVLAMA